MIEIIAFLLSKKDESKTEINLSVSKAKTFEDCKAKYKYCYIEKLPRIEQDFHTFGLYLHKVLENFHRVLIEDPSKRDDWRSVMDAAWESAYIEYETKMTGVQYKEAREIVEEYKTILEKDGLPNVIAVEKQFYINLNNKVLLNGLIDRIQIDPDGLIHVADYKTTKDPKYLKDFFQLMTYCYALCLEDKSITKIRASFILLRHNFNYLTQEFTREEVISVAEKFIQAACNIEEEKLWRPNPQFLCKYCDYINNCKSGKDFLIKRGILKKPKPVVGIRKW
jgi:CRISPR/Cas system-associated exonuclease Cas4 (RecB family)